jgi:putative Mn2+ efflux pump MntP
MNLASVIVLAFAMSTDAFAAAVGKGASLHKPRISEALRTGVIFGAIEALTPLVGWGLGSVAARYATEWDHWIAFGLLCGLGALMIRNGLKDDPEQAAPATRHSFWVLAATGFATSIDAMAVGVSLAFIENNIVVTAAIIGMATLLMVTLGVMLGRVVGRIVGKHAEVLGGLALVGIGGTILYQHLRG